jgi:hypothetical protein
MTEDGSDMPVFEHMQHGVYAIDTINRADTSSPVVTMVQCPDFLRPL